jgi:hypothetical protein
VDDVQESLVRDHPHGLNSEKQFDFIMLNTQMVNRSILNRMRELQPKAAVRLSTMVQI